LVEQVSNRDDEKLCRSLSVAKCCEWHRTRKPPHDLMGTGCTSPSGNMIARAAHLKSQTCHQRQYARTFTCFEKGKNLSGYIQRAQDHSTVEIGEH